MLDYLFVELQMIDATTTAATHWGNKTIKNIESFRSHQNRTVPRANGKRQRVRSSDELATNREDDYLFCSCRVLVLGWFFFLGFWALVLALLLCCTCVVAAESKLLMCESNT
jgi:hypothetical protein